MVHRYCNICFSESRQREFGCWFWAWVPFDRLLRDQDIDGEKVPSRLHTTRVRLSDIKPELHPILESGGKEAMRYFVTFNSELRCLVELIDCSPQWSSDFAENMDHLVAVTRYDEQWAAEKREAIFALSMGLHARLVNRAP
jgi:hypothetical protein